MVGMKFLKFLSAAALALFAAGAAPANGAVKVVTSSQDLAWVVKTIGGNQVTVSYLGSSNQDPHHVEPRPSQVLEISHCDLAVRTGMDLDTWFDSLLRSSGNGKVMPGAKGYVDSSSGIHPRDPQRQARSEPR